MAAVINKLVEAVGDLELHQMFTMRQIRMGRTKPGALVDPMTGKLPVQHITLADLFDSQRDAFVQQLMQEMAEAQAETHDENADSQTFVSDQGDGHGASASGSAKAEAEDGAGDRASRIVIAES